MVFFILIFTCSNINGLTVQNTKIKEFLDAKLVVYNNPDFIRTDPIAIPHQFVKKEDIEIAGFLTASIAWGNRKSIITSGMRMMELMDYQPSQFIHDFTDHDVRSFSNFAHRTFNSIDVVHFLYALKNIYQQHGGLEKVFREGSKPFIIIEPLKHEGVNNVSAAINNIQYIGNIKQAISYFKRIFFEIPHPARTLKHVSDPMRGSAAKRINMFLRWMVRNDSKGVDFGIWRSFDPKELYCPLDVHSGRVARQLGLLSRKQDDWNAVEELTARLREFDANDPVKYDLALFGMGVFEA